MNFWGKSSLEDLQEGMNRLFDQVWHSGVRTGPFDGQDWAPPMTVIDKPDRYVIELELAGIALEDVEVTATANTITVKGEKTESGAREEDDHALVCERRFGSFRRVINLPDEIDGDRLKASLQKGVLTIAAPRTEVRTEPAVKVTIEDRD